MVQVDVGTFPLLYTVHVFVSVLDSFEFVLISVSLQAVSVMKRWFINIVVG